MAHAQKPDFVFQRKGRGHLNRREHQFKSTTGSRGVRMSGSNAGYTMFRGSVKSTGYPLHSPVSPSLLQPCVTVCHHISTGVYLLMMGPDMPETCRRRNILRISCASSWFFFTWFIIVFDMFRTSTCSSLGRHIYAVLCYFFHASI
jgi:hypothetical protein